MLPRILLLLGVLMLSHLALCTEDYYKTLGLTKSATEKQLKSAYRSLSKKYHPDKNNGDPAAHEQFVAVSSAYEILSDPTTRQIYDTQGHAGIQRHKESGGRSSQGHDPFDLFSRFFGGGGHFQAQQRRGPNMELKVALSLRDFYMGVDTELEWEKQHVCEDCGGSGASDGKVEDCHACGGHGVRIRKQMLAPGMYQQVQVACDVCNQRGKVVKNKCPVCQGNRVIRKKTPLFLKVGRGARRDSKLVYENEADASPDYVAGDLILHLSEKDPSLHEENPDQADGVFFRRKDDNLYWTEVLSVREAWMGGWTRNLTHLDGHVVQLKRERGQVVQPGMVEKVVGEGMPIWHEDGDDVYHETTYGDLFVEYVVILADQMESEMEKDFWELFEKWRGRVGVSIDQEAGRPVKETAEVTHDEL